MKTNFILISLLSFSFVISARTPIPSKRFEQLSGGSKKVTTKNLWDKKYSKKNYVYGKAPEKFLAENYHYIPQGGLVLDVGVGEGRHAVFLSQKGYKVFGIDISSVALKKARKMAQEYDVRFETVRGDIRTYNFQDIKFDAIINFYYVNREIKERLVSLLKPNGVMIYEAFTSNQKTVEGFKRFNDDFLLEPGELLSFFPTMKILKYEEPLHENNYRASGIYLKPKP